MNRTGIAWVKNPDGTPGFTWNPAIGCSAEPASKGCENCWAARLAATRLAHKEAHRGIAALHKTAVAKDGGHAKVVDSVGRWTGETKFFPCLSA